MPSTRREASRTTANASGSRSSSVSPFSKRRRNSAVLPESDASLRFVRLLSNALIRSTYFCIRLISFSLSSPKTFFKKPSNYNQLPWKYTHLHNLIFIQRLSYDFTRNRDGSQKQYTCQRIVCPAFLVVIMNIGRCTNERG